MKTIVVFLRILIVGLLWGIIFTEGIRVIMLCNWRFDIFWPDHWRQAIALWKAGWVVRAPKEWAFVLLIITFIPMLITGWWTLCMVAWENIIWKIITLPITLYHRFIKAPLNVISTNNRYGVTKRKSYKQIRPAGVNTLHAPISDYGGTPVTPVSSYTASPSPYSTATATTSPYSNFNSQPTSTPTPAKKTDVAATIDHALFKFDDDEDDFDLDIDSFEKTDIKKSKAEDNKKIAKKYSFDDDDDNDDDNAKPTRRSKKYRFDDDDDDNDDDEDYKSNRNRKEKNRRDEDKKEEKRTRNNNREDDTRTDKNKRSQRRDEENKSVGENRGPVYDALLQKNYDVISNVTVKNTLIDFIGVSDDNICLCLVDKEAGDWLADEEMFNGEEPLWFSENNHRISPVCKLNSARKVIQEMLAEEDFEQELKSFVVIQMANIINADDMFEIWDDMNIEVTRINRGAPKEIRLFSKTLNEAENKISKKELDRLRNLLKNLK